MSDDEPFFEPYPENDEIDEEEVEHDWPWQPPRHVVGVVVPLHLVLHRDDDTVVVLTHGVCYRRGLELHVSTRTRPGSGNRSPIGDWRLDAPRMGLRLPDGARLGHRAEGPEPDPWSPPDAPTLVSTGGDGGTSGYNASWWLTPWPEVDSADMVVEWAGGGVPEVSAGIELGALRARATEELVLWDPPPPPVPPSEGWFAYAPMSGAVHPSRAVVGDGPSDEVGQG